MADLSFNYYIGTQMRNSWGDYIRAGSVVSAINRGSKEAMAGTAANLSKCIDRQTRSIVGSVESLERSISMGLQDVSGSVEELGRDFQWGMSQVLSSMGGMQDSLDQLLATARTPAQTAAYEQFEIARDAFRKRLYPECLCALRLAIDGAPGSTPGYKLDWRFYELEGLVRLGSFENADPRTLDTVAAETAFTAAARYATSDFPKDAAKALLSAGWAAYINSKGDSAGLEKAVALTSQALELDEFLAEAHFQRAKGLAALGRIDESLASLGKAIDFGGIYAAKAAGDGDFAAWATEVRPFLETVRTKKAEDAKRLALDILNYARDLARNARVADMPSLAELSRANAYANDPSHTSLVDAADYVAVLAEKDRGAIKEELERLGSEEANRRSAAAWSEELRKAEKRKKMLVPAGAATGAAAGIFMGFAAQGQSGAALGTRALAAVLMGLFFAVLGALVGFLFRLRQK